MFINTNMYVYKILSFMKFHRQKVVQKWWLFGLKQFASKLTLHLKTLLPVKRTREFYQMANWETLLQVKRINV